MKQIPKEFLTTPIVYAVKNIYQIMVPVNTETVMWVQVGEKCFYDDSNGILRSSCGTHRINVPMELLNKEKKYKVCYRIIYERKPYFTDSSEVFCYESNFRPVEKEPVHIYHIADAHSRVKEPVMAGNYFGKDLDLLILNGDIPDHSGKIENFATIHQIASQITNGEIPVVFSRGNHDTRGIYAENFADYTPTDNGVSYYTFRLGHLWGMVLDCGEDKVDSNLEYGNTVCCEDFRRRETEYLKSIIENARHEYEADGVKNRLVICHVPFTERAEPPFDIEEELYTEWAKLLKDFVKPQLMICGHIHKCYINEIGGPNDQKGQPCVVIVASQPEENNHMGGAFTLYPDHCNVKFTDINKQVSYETEIKF